MALHSDRSPSPRMATKRTGGGRRLASGVAIALSLAGAPVFTGMALLTATVPDSLAICGPVPAEGWGNGMVIMYLLMAVTHLAPWLRLATSD